MEKERLISANTLKAAFENAMRRCRSTFSVRFWNIALDAVNSMPTVEAEPVIHARWDIRVNPGCFDTYGRPDKYAHCTHCGFRWGDLYSVKNYFKRCPGCGAIMNLEDE